MTLPRDARGRLRERSWNRRPKWPQSGASGEPAGGVWGRWWSGLARRAAALAATAALAGCVAPSPRPPYVFAPYPGSPYSAPYSTPYPGTPYYPGSPYSDPLRPPAQFGTPLPLPLLPETPPPPPEPDLASPSAPFLPPGVEPPGPSAPEEALPPGVAQTPGTPGPAASGEPPAPPAAARADPPEGSTVPMVGFRPLRGQRERTAP